MIFTDQTLIVSGAAVSGGHEFTRVFATTGANLVSVDFDTEVLSIETAEFGVQPVQADVGSTEEVHRVVDVALERLGRIGVLVNNAGILRHGVLWKMTDDDWKPSCPFAQEALWHRCVRRSQGMLEPWARRHPSYREPEFIECGR